MKKCKFCKHLFNSIYAWTKYCSIECQRGQFNLTQNLKRKCPILKCRRCKVCHDWFQPKCKLSCYCSIECRQKQENLNRRIKNKRLPLKKRQCKCCNCWFQPKYKNSKYCCQNCRENFHQTISKKKLKQKAVLYKGGKCKKCGYNKCLTALDFHHRNPRYKGANFRKTTWKKLKKELDKCDLLCANCHREIHAKILLGA